MSLRSRLYVALWVIAGTFLTAAVWEVIAYQKARQEVLSALASNQDLLEVSNNLVVTLIISVLIDFILLGLAWYFVRKWIMEPLGRIKGVMKKIASGQITKAIRPVGPTEISELAQAAEEMRQNLVAQIDFTRSAEQTLQDERSQTLGNEIRKALAPSFRNSELADYEVDAYSQAASGVISGDWWDVFFQKSDSGDVLGTYLVLVDVEGHDPATGIAALQVKAVMKEQLQFGTSPEVVIEKISRLLARVDNKLMSAFILALPGRGSHAAQWLNAGHPVGNVFSKTGHQQVLAPTGMLIAGIEGQWSMEEFDWPEEGTVVITTDGLVELRDVSNNEFGNDKIISAVTKQGMKSPREVVDHIVNAAQTFSSDAKQHDWMHEDITVIAITRRND